MRHDWFVVLGGVRRSSGSSYSNRSGGGCNGSSHSHCSGGGGESL